MNKRTKPQEKGMTLNEFRQTYFPNSVLNRLEERIISAFQIRQSRKDDRSVQREKKDALQGHVIVPKNYSASSYFVKSLSEVVREFYISEGFEILSPKNENFFEVRKGKQIYLVMPQEFDNEYNVHITTPII